MGLSLRCLPTTIARSAGQFWDLEEINPAYAGRETQPTPAQPGLDDRL